MMNKSQTLTDAQSAKVAQYGAFLASALGQRVVVNFRKRDGQGEGSGLFRTLRGDVESVKSDGDQSKAHVVIRTEEGFRTANLWTIQSARLDG